MSEQESTEVPIPTTDTLAAHATSDTEQADVDVTFTAFYLETIKPLVGFLLLQGARLADATDIAQDTMTAAYGRWRSIEHPRAWAHRVASRALIRKIASVREDSVIETPEPSPLLRATNIEL
jgi:DNA-directed RNA polymerase specialized sigma24 family protein